MMTRTKNRPHILRFNIFLSYDADIDSVENELIQLARSVEANLRIVGHTIHSRNREKFLHAVIDKESFEVLFNASLNYENGWKLLRGPVIPWGFENRITEIILEDSNEAMN